MPTTPFPSCPRRSQSRWTSSEATSSPWSASTTDSNSADATIAESDPITVRLAGPTQVSVNSQAEYRVFLDKFPSANLTVSYATTDGTATSSTDYTAVSGALTFAPGETSKTVTVSVGGTGAGKSFDFSILDPDGGGGPDPQLGTPSTITTTIVGGNAAPVDRKRFSLSAVPASVAENAGATSGHGHRHLGRKSDS